MKKYLFLVLAIAIFACTQQEEGFKIKVTLEGAEGQVLLEERGPQGWIAIDTADIVEGVAVLEGKTSYPKEHYLSVMGSRAKGLIFVENAEISVSGKADSINVIKVSGSITHDEYMSVNDKLEPIVNSYMDPYQESREAQAAGDTAKARQLMEKVQALYEEASGKIIDVQKDFIKNNEGSYAVPAFLNQLQRSIDVDELDALVSGLDSKLDSVTTIVSLKEKIVKLKRVAVGQIAPDFTQNDTEGNPVKFSDFYSQNELTLLDFWAAWCGPCRAENPNVVAVYNQFKDKGFNVIGVSLDREKDAWLKAIEDDGLPWMQVSDLGYWNNEVSQMYAISSIPSSLIVDKNGKIVAKNKRGAELGETVAELLAN